jgi:hypothetical protein
MLLMRRCRRGSTTSGESRFVRRTLGSRGVSTGLQSHIPKVRNTRSAYPACTIFPVLAALSHFASQIFFDFPFICPLKSGKEFLLKSAHSCSRLAANQAVIDVSRDIDSAQHANSISEYVYGVSTQLCVYTYGIYGGVISGVST